MSEWIECICGADIRKIPADSPWADDVYVDRNGGAVCYPYSVNDHVRHEPYEDPGEFIMAPA